MHERNTNYAVLPLFGCILQGWARPCIFLPLEKPLSDLCEVRQFHAPPLGPEGGGALGHTDDSKLMSND